METKLNKLSDILMEVEVTLSYDEIKSDIEKAYEKEKDNIAIPGFRKGKVPTSMLKKMYGEAIEYKAAEEISNTKFWEAVDELKLEPVSAPSLLDLQYKNGEPLVFKVNFEVKPELEIKDYKDQTIEKIIFNVRDEDIEAEVNRLKSQSVDFEEAEVVEDDSKINIDLLRVDENGEPFAGAQPEKLDIRLDEENVNPEVKENAKGKKVGETFNFNFVDEHNHGEEVHKVEYFYNCTVNKIEKVIPRDPSEDEIKKFTRDKASTMDELKTFLRDEYQRYNEQQTEQLFTNSLVSKIVANNEFEVPQGYVNSLHQNMLKAELENAKRNNQPVDDKMLNEQLKPRAEFTAKWQIISDNIARMEELQVTDDDIKELAEKQAAQTGISVEKLVNYLKESNKTDSLLDEKIMKFLIDNNNIVERDAEEVAKEQEAKAKAESSETENSEEK